MEKVTVEGFSVVTAALGLIGGILGITFSEPMSKKQQFAAALSAIVCGGIGPEAIAVYWPVPGVIKNLIAIALGVGGLFIVPGILQLFRGFATDPWGWLDRLRGKGADK